MHIKITYVDCDQLKSGIIYVYGDWNSIQNCLYTLPGCTSDNIIKMEKQAMCVGSNQTY